MAPLSTSTLPTLLVAVTAGDFSADELAARLRHHRPPIVARVEEGACFSTCGTVLGPAEEAEIIRALRTLAG